MNKKLLYNNIMKNVAAIVKHHINESNDIYNEDEEEFASYYDIMDKLESMGYNEGDIIPADDLYKAIHLVGFPWERKYDEAEFEDEFNVKIDWSDDDTLTESLNDIYNDDDTFMFDDDKEDEFYDSDGNWDPVEEDDIEIDVNTPAGHICDVVGGIQYVDFTKTSPVHLTDANVDIEQIDSDGDIFSVTLTDTDGDTYELSDFTDNDIQLLSDAVDEYLNEIDEY